MTRSAWPFRPRDSLRGAVVLASAAVILTIVAVATGDGSPSRSRAIAFSGTIACGAALTGWGVTRWPWRSASLAVAASLAGVVARIMIPLAALAWLQTSGSDLRAAGADRWLVVFYLTLLATDIALTIMDGARNRPTGGGRAEN